MCLYSCYITSKKDKMNTVVHCKLNGKKLRITNNAIEIEDSCLQEELIKSLIDCKAKTPLGESSLPLFFNKYLRNYEISEIVLSESVPRTIYQTNFEEMYIDKEIEVMAA